MSKSFKLSDQYIVQVYTVNNLPQLKEAWDSCAANNGSYFPFLCFDWFVNWIKHFPETELHLPVLYENGAIAAIMPMMQKVVKKRGIRLQTFAFVGNAYSQARAILHNSTDPEKRIQQAELLFRYFLQYAPVWDYLDLYGLQPENGNTEQIMQAVKSCGLHCTRTVAYQNCYQDAISQTAEGYMQTRPSTVRKNAPYYRRKMQREGELQFRLVTTDDNLDSVMDSYYQLYAKSWKQSEDLGPTFHRDLAILAAEKGWLRLGFLDFNSWPIACQLWLVQDTTGYALKVFYDQAYKQYSPGTVLSETMLRTLMEHDQIAAFDYLQGDEPYKHDWVDGQRSRDHLIIFNTTFKSQVLVLLETIFRRVGKA